MNHKRRRRTANLHPLPGLVHALFARQTGTISDLTFRASVYTSIVPSSTFVNVSDVPNVTFRRFSPCGRYLISLSNNNRDLVVYTVETGARRQLPTSSSTPASDVFGAVAHPPIVTPSTYHPSQILPSSPTLIASPPLIPTHRRMPPPPFHSMPQPAAGLLGQIHVPLRTAPLLPNMPMAHLHPIRLAGTNAIHQPAPPPPVPPRVPTHTVNELRRNNLKHTCPFSRFFSKKFEVPIATGSDTLLSNFCLATPSASHLILATVHRREEEDPPPAPDNNEPNNPRPVRTPALSTPVQTTFTLHLVSLSTGRVADRFTLHDDYVIADAHAGVHMRGNLLAILSMRFQAIHLVRVCEDPPLRFRVEGAVGYHCRRDDADVIEAAHVGETVWRQRQQAQMEALPLHHSSDGGTPTTRRRPRHGVDTGHDVRGGVDEGGAGNNVAVNDIGGGGGDGNDDGDGNGVQNVGNNNGDGDERYMAGGDGGSETGLGNGKVRRGFYTGLMQRLLVYVYLRYLAEGKQSLFYRVVGQYSLLLMQKVQLLDDDHLLIRLGSVDRLGEVSDVMTNTCFFVVYNFRRTEIVNLYNNRSAELAGLYDSMRDDFIGDAAVSAMLPVAPTSGGGLMGGGVGGSFAMAAGRARMNARSHSNAAPTSASTGRPQARNAPERRTQTTLAALPVSSQHRNASVYLDRSLFLFNRELLPALDGTRPLALREEKCFRFRSARTGRMLYKLPAGTMLARGGEDGGGGGGGGGASGRLKMACLFHPSLPLVLSMEQGAAVGMRLNFHVYGHHGGMSDEQKHWT